MTKGRLKEILHELDSVYPDDMPILVRTVPHPDNAFFYLELEPAYTQISAFRYRTPVHGNILDTLVLAASRFKDY